MTGVLAIAHYTIAAGNVEAVEALVIRLEVASRAEPGCLGFDSYSKVGDELRVVLVEKYESQESFDAHRATPHFADLVLGQLVPLLTERRVEQFPVEL